MLDAGLSNFEAFLANAFFAAGQVLFEVPTGMLADTLGRRMSYLLGAGTLAGATLVYLLMWHLHGPFWGWASASVLLGLGFTFFSGALEAWLVDALQATNFKGKLDDVFATGETVEGAAMLAGSIAGGVLAQFTNLGVPYLVRALILLLNFGTAFFWMQDLGFSPKRINQPLREMKTIFRNSIDQGLKNPPVRWLLLAAPFTTGVSFYIFYALQPFLLELYGKETAYGIAGLAAAIAALAQMAGGFLAPQLRRLFSTRTSALLLGTLCTGLILLLVATVNRFWLALGLIFGWGLIFAALLPLRQAYLNGVIPSDQRATLLSFDSLMGASGGIFIQPLLGKAADVWSYATSYATAALVQSAALPFILLARREKTESDIINAEQ